MPALAKDYRTLLKRNRIEKEIPEFVINNLNPNLPLRYYQNEALQVFFDYFNEPQYSKPFHLLFQMATGSGKTLVMAALILYLWKQGYRNFLFFVNATNIIEKTKQNFLNNSSSKYLFSNQIVIDNKCINIREVQNFDESNSNDINIVFITVQGLHSLLNNSRENSITLEDFKDKKIVLLSDEAHHINVLTRLKKKQTGNLFNNEVDNFKGLNKSEAEDLKTWEGAVNSIYQQNKENIMLEFTATIDLGNENIKEKYENKIIYQYDLKQFREDGFSKNIELFQVDADPMYRAMSAVILSQYRLKIAQKHKLNIKPVILFKSKTINESEQFANSFRNHISNLKEEYLTLIKETSKEKNKGEVLDEAFTFFEKNEISLENIVLELKEDFSEEKILEINSQKESESNQIKANSLEDKDNMIRAIFVVDMLNEGWDVLNLFDIVRLYETRDMKDGKPGKATISEAQLIGRGARYCPFEWNDNNKFKRKFDITDNVSENELKVLEELYYHSRFDSRYIYELKKTLEESGILAKDRVTKRVEVKDTFKDSDWWKYGVIYLNERKENSKKDIIDLKSIEDIRTKFYKERVFTYKDSQADIDNKKLNLEDKPEKEEKKVKLKNLGLNVVRSAMYYNDFYSFSNLKKYFKKLKSINEFLISDDFLDVINIKLKNLKNKDNISQIAQDEKLRIAVNVLKDLEQDIKRNISDFEGTKSFTPHLLRNKIKDKEIEFSKDDAREEKNCSNLDWIAQKSLRCTSEEISFIEYFQENLLDNFKNKYNSLYLIRNERFCKMYNFENGEGFEPDFLLLLKENDYSIPVAYQIWIEPKGNQFKDSNGVFENSSEGWKQKMLMNLKEFAKKDNSKIKNISLDISKETILDKYNYKILGLPFYNAELERKHNIISKYLHEANIIDEESRQKNLV